MCSCSEIDDGVDNEQQSTTTTMVITDNYSQYASDRWSVAPTEKANSNIIVDATVYVLFDSLIPFGQLFIFHTHQLKEREREANV